MFTKDETKQIEKHGLTTTTVTEQINYFKNGFPPTQLESPSLINDGIISPNESTIQSYITSYSSKAGSKKIVKFVPASGAATRMFKNLFDFVGKYDGSDAAYHSLISNQKSGSVFEFFKRLNDFAFYADLKNEYLKTGKSLEEAHLSRKYVSILNCFLSESGLNYGNLPKGLLKFHPYGENARTPVEEHMAEGCQYTRSKNEVNIHFTVSPEHLVRFEQHVNDSKGIFEKEFNVKIRITYSIQKPSTDTIAVDLENRPFRNADGTLLFRPAGHGALLENLNDVDADIIFLKNIDNVVPDHLKEKTIVFKKVLGGILLEIQETIFGYLKQLEENGAATKHSEIAKFINEKLGYRIAENATADQLKKILNRPVRVCGMVRSEGDPGGGPFWTKATNGEVTLQIVETAQIDLSDDQQKKIFNSATHFNPVDLVCGVKNYKGKKFDLLQYRDPSAGFVTQKSKDGKELKAQELPGLWNGSMAHWNTIFVEVPVITFNPVKTVNDLLKPEHQ